MTDFSLFLEQLKGFDKDLGMFRGSDVTLIQVDIVCIEPVKACVTAIDDAVYRLVPEGISLTASPVANLCRDIDLRSLAFERFACVDFTLTTTVAIRGIKQINACIESRVDGVEGLLFFNWTPLSADAPASHGDSAHIPPRFPKRSILHDIPPCLIEIDS